MKCNECSYAADYIDGAEPVKKQCDITSEVHEADFECNCVAQRQLYDKRERMISEYQTIKQAAASGGLSSVCIICGQTVDHEFGVTKVCATCKETIQFITEKKSAIMSLVTKYEQALADQAPGESMED